MSVRSTPVNGVDASHGAQTADRAIEVLLTVAESDEPLGLSEISRRTGFNASATYRLVGALMRHSLLARDDDRRSYGPGGGLVALAAAVMSRVSVPQASIPAMERLRALTSETVSLYVRDDRHRICVAVVEGLHPMRWVVPVGDRQPLSVGLTGKVILAFLPEAEIAAPSSTTAGAACSATSRVKRSAGPEIVSAAATPEASKTGTDSPPTPAIRSPTSARKPASRTRSSCVAIRAR